MTKRIVHALVRNCRSYTDGPKAFQTFAARNRRLWDMATAAGVADEVTREIVPPLRTHYPNSMAAQASR